MPRWRRFVRNQFLPLGLAVAALSGAVAPAPGQYMAALPTQQVAVVIIFFCSGLLLRLDEVKAALTAWRATVWGTVAILGITPVIGAWLAFQLPLAPEFQMGLALFCCMPTTLSSGIALTGQARGNVALAVLLTVLTNLLGIFTVPVVLTALLGLLGEVRLSATQLLGQLLLAILLPLVVGQFLRRWVAACVDRHRYTVGLVSNLALISVPWMKFSQSSRELGQLGPATLAGIAVSGLAIHGLYLLLGLGSCRLLRLPLPLTKAVVLQVSQKTMPVALTVLTFLPLPVATKGLMAIPCVTTHLGQIVFDALIATRWARRADAAAIA